jgi:AraC family transcriptional regulator
MDAGRQVMRRRAASRCAEPDPLALALRRKALQGHGGSAASRAMAKGEGWQVYDICCTCGPGDRPYEERRQTTSISLVVSGSFAFRDARGRALLGPGSLLLVNAGRAFECSHHHGEGDRCLSFHYEPELMDRLAHDAGAARPLFDSPVLPPLRALAGLTARAMAAAESACALEEVAFALVGAVIPHAGRPRRSAPCSSAQHHARISRVLREMERDVARGYTIAGLARMAGLSPYHFLRTFKHETGITPHQWLLRARLRDAARRLASSQAPVTEVALDAGFEDLSNFMRTFRAEFGISPRRYRLAA